jgi:uroporphyrinogen-III synthase
MPEVLSTKELNPLLLDKAKAAGVHIFERTMISIRGKSVEDIRNNIEQSGFHTGMHLVFTSNNAVECAAPVLNTFTSAAWKVFCLAGRTASAVKQLMQRAEIVATANNASRLAEIMVSKNIPQVAFFCGDKRRDELPATLEKAGIDILQIVVYRTIETPVKVDEDVDAILFFSPSAVESFFQLNQPAARTVCFAIGTTTAERLSAHKMHHVIISPEPTQEQIIEDVISHFSDTNKNVEIK